MKTLEFILTTVLGFVISGFIVFISRLLYLILVKVSKLLYPIDYEPE